MSSGTPMTPGRTLRLALLAFVIGFVAVAVGYGQTHFLISAYHHGGL